MTATELRERVERALCAACLAEVRALKPGNVGVRAPGHGMRARDFAVSARVAAAALTAPAAGVGERVLCAVTATRAAVGCNTNLGILLLCAPLAHAALLPERAPALRHRLEDVLAALSRRDAVLAYRAIRLAAPGGLGTAPDHDVRRAPWVTLRAAMVAAADRDRIARQYACGYADIFDLGLPWFRLAIARHGTLRPAVTSLYLAFLARFPDSLIARKHGPEAARELSRGALELHEAFEAEGMTEHLRARLRELDAALKAGSINPGTTADLTAATLFVWYLERDRRAEGGRWVSAPGRSDRAPVGAPP